MDDKALNDSIRKFLKSVGVNSQIAIEKAVREAHEAGKLDGGALPASMTLTIDKLNLHLTFDDNLTLD